MIRMKENIKITFEDKKALYRLSKAFPLSRDVLDVGVELFLKVNLPFLVLRFILIIARVEINVLVQTYITVVEICITLALAYAQGQTKFRLKPSHHFKYALFWRVGLAKVILLQSSFAMISRWLLELGLPQITVFLVPFVLILLFTPVVIGWAVVHAWWATVKDIADEELAGWNPDDNYRGKPAKEFLAEREQKLLRLKKKEAPFVDL